MWCGSSSLNRATGIKNLALPRTGGAPYLARFSRDVGGDRWSPLYNLEGYQAERSGIPHLAKMRKTSEIWGTPGSWQGNRRTLWYIAEINVYLCDALN